MLAVVLTVAACGGNGGSTTLPQGTTSTTAGGHEVTIRTTEFSFSPAAIEVPAGVPVTFVVINDGVIEHDFTIEELDVEILVNPGETGRQTITIPAGTYMIHCTVPGHHDAGMTGSLTAR